MKLDLTAFRKRQAEKVLVTPTPMRADRAAYNDWLDEQERLARGPRDLVETLAK